MSDAFDPFAGLPNPFSDPEVTTLTDKPTTTRCDGICARCDGAGTIPDWSAGRLPCPACKPMEGSEATTAGAIRQSLASGEAIADVTQIQGLVRERNDLARQLAEAKQQAFRWERKARQLEIERNQWIRIANEHEEYIARHVLVPRGEDGKT